MTSASWPTWPGQSGHLGRRVPRSAERFQHRGGSVGALGASSQAETHPETAVAGQSGHSGRRVPTHVVAHSGHSGSRVLRPALPKSPSRGHTLTRWTGTRTPHSGMPLEHSSAPTRGTWTAALMGCCGGPRGRPPSRLSSVLRWHAYPCGSGVASCGARAVPRAREPARVRGGPAA